MDVNAFEQAEAGCEIAQHLSKAIEIHEGHGVLSGDEKSGLERIHERLKNICLQKNKTLSSMSYPDCVKLWDCKTGRDKLKWYSDEMQAGRPKPPTLFRFVKEKQALDNHFAGKLWFRSPLYFRKIEGNGKDVSEGIGSYALPDGRICRDVNDDNPTVFILSFGEQAESLKGFGEYCLEVRNPLELKRRVESRLCPGSQVKWKKIKYDKVMDQENNVIQLETDPSPREDRDLMYCSKPETFAEEKEWRLLISLPMRLLNHKLKLHVGDLKDVLERYFPS